MTEILFILIRAAIAICGVLLTAKFIPWLSGQIGAQETAELIEWVKVAVAAAEQIYDSSDGAEKKAYVLKFLTAQGFDVDADALDNLIEAAVLELHNALDLSIADLSKVGGS